MADAVILVSQDNPDVPLLYACPKCGGVHSPRTYLASKERSHKAAREAAEDCYSCKTHYNCDICGCETTKGWTRCRPCRVKALLDKAEEVPDNGGPYCEFDGDNYYFDIDDAAEAGLEWVSPCHAEYPKIDPDTVLEGLVEQMFEDASCDDLDGIDELRSAIEAFNKAQSVPTFFGDSKRKIRVPAQAIEASGQDPKGLDAQHESAVGNADAPEG